MRKVSRQKEARKEGRVAYDAAMEEWAATDQERKDERDAIKANNAKTKAAWDKRKAAAVKKNKKFTEPKPKSMPLPKAIPRPKLKDFLDSGGGLVGASEAADDAGSDSDEGDDVGSQGGSVSDDKEKLWHVPTTCPPRATSTHNRYSGHLSTNCLTMYAIPLRFTSNKLQIVHN